MAITIRQIHKPSGVRIMGQPYRLRADVQDDRPSGETRPLNYRWTIIDNPTGHSVILNSSSPSPYLEVWQDPSDHLKGLGHQLNVGLKVGYGPEMDQEDELRESILIEDYNEPPVPVIKGRFGTLQTPLLTGESCTFNSYDSYDPDGGSPGSRWDYGSKRGGEYDPAQTPIFGPEGEAASFTIPKMTAPIQQVIVLALVDGLHEIKATATAYLAPAEQGTPSERPSASPSSSPSDSPEEDKFEMKFSGGVSLYIVESVCEQAVRDGNAEKKYGVPVGGPPPVWYESKIPIEDFRDLYDTGEATPSPRPTPSEEPQPMFPWVRRYVMKTELGLDTGISIISQEEELTQVHVDFYQTVKPWSHPAIHVGEWDFWIGPNQEVSQNVKANLGIKGVVNMAKISSTNPLTVAIILILPPKEVDRDGNPVYEYIPIISHHTDR